MGDGAFGYDCLMIPGAAEGPMCNALGTAGDRMNANRFCGNSAGLAIKMMAQADNANMKQGTVCSKDVINYVHNYRT